MFTPTHPRTDNEAILTPMAASVTPAPAIPASVTLAPAIPASDSAVTSLSCPSTSVTPAAETDVTNLPAVHKPVRSDCKYTAEEVAAIIGFREDFMKKRTIPDRIAMLKCQIAPTLFSYWKSKGKVPANGEEMQLWTKVWNIIPPLSKDICSTHIFF